jgi:hypothetical protein
VVDLSSSLDEEDLIPDTSRNFEFAQRLYGELNHALLGPSGDGQIIILSDSDEEKEEVHEEKSTDAGDTTAYEQSTPPQPPPPTTPMLLWGQRMIIVMIKGLIRRLAVRTAAEMSPMSLRLPCQ